MRSRPLFPALCGRMGRRETRDRRRSPSVSRFARPPLPPPFGPGHVPRGQRRGENRRSRHPAGRQVRADSLPPPPGSCAGAEKTPPPARVSPCPTPLCRSAVPPRAETSARPAADPSHTAQKRGPPARDLFRAPIRRPPGRKGCPRRSSPPPRPPSEKEPDRAKGKGRGQGQGKGGGNGKGNTRPKNRSPAGAVRTAQGTRPRRRYPVLGDALSPTPRRPLSPLPPFPRRYRPPPPSPPSPQIRRALARPPHPPKNCPFPCKSKSNLSE